MKKTIIIISLFIICFITSSKIRKKNIIIPSESIRFRVIANSNNKEDQQLKYQVKDNLNAQITSILKDSTSLDASRKSIVNNLKNIENNISNTILENNSSQDFKVSYCVNHFPEKIYKGVTYTEGDYESLVVTLGEGQGENWWCVLFPPLCLLEAEENDTEQTEYKLFVEKIIDQFRK